MEDMEKSIYGLKQTQNLALQSTNISQKIKTSNFGL
jgi:hypothetical protein